MNETLYRDSWYIIEHAIRAVLPDEVVRRALCGRQKYRLTLSKRAWAQLEQELPDALDNVETMVTGSVRELCAAAQACRELGYQPVTLTDRLCCQAREAGSFLASIARSHADGAQSKAFIAGGETVVRLTGKGKGGRNQELALAAAPGIAGLENVAVFSVGSDGTDGHTDAAGGIVIGDNCGKLKLNGISVDEVLQNNDSYAALSAVGGLS